jgi:hypothetical protein
MYITVMNILKKTISFVGLKSIRLLSFVIFRNRRGLRTPYGSYLSPKEIECGRTTQISKEISQIRSWLTPHHVGYQLNRIGSLHDGGYYLIEQDFKNAFLVSGGIETNNDFEMELANLGTRGIQIDYSIESPPNQHGNLRFIQKKITDFGTGQNEISLNQLYEQLREELECENSSNILKLDIEGSEWSSLSNFDYLKSFNQVVVEFHQLHNLADDVFRSTAFSLFEKLQESHICVYSGGNNCCGFSVIAGHPFPNVLEVTFVSRKNIQFSREMTRSEIEKLMVPNLGDRSSLVWF